MPSLFMRIFAHDLSGNCLGGAKSRFKASLRVGVAPLIITLPPARIRSWVSKSIQDENYWTPHNMFRTPTLKLDSLRCSEPLNITSCPLPAKRQFLIQPLPPNAPREQ